MRGERVIEAGWGFGGTGKHAGVRRRDLKTVGGGRSRDRRLVGIALALAAVLAVLLLASSAQAGTIHQFESSFKLTGPNPIPGAIAIDEEAEVLYAINMGQSTFQRFDLAGNPI